MIAGSTLSQAQALEGIYRLQGGHEMAAEFHFTADGRFEFGFAYGAVDREASGTYSIDKGQITFHSNKTPGKDFTVKHRERKGEGSTVHVSDANPYLTRHVICFFKKGDRTDQVYTDESGVAHSEMTGCDSIFVFHSLFPDAMTTIKDVADTTNNYFELGLNPSLAGVSFKGIHPRLDKNTIVIEMPWLFEKKEAVFAKEQDQ
jgi:hypothetical protein